MRLRTRLLGMSAGLSVMAGVLMAPGTAQAVVLPTPDCGIDATDNCLVFQDFTVFSLALLNFQTGESQIGPGDSFFVKSTPGELGGGDYLVVGTGPEGNVKDNGDQAPGAADDAYDTPQNIPQNPSVNSLFLPGLEPDPTFTGDNAAESLTSVYNPDAPRVPGAEPPVTTLPLWDIQVPALDAFLGDDELVFYFNLNESNADGLGLDNGQDMLGFMQVWLTDLGADGAVGGGDDSSISFTLGGLGQLAPCYSLGDPISSIATTACGNQNTDVDDILPTSDDKWAYVHGFICVSNDGALLGFGTCADAGQDGNTVKQNIGADQAAFALYSDALDNAVKSGAWDIMSVDLRMGHIDNGYEQLFILATEIGEVPPPPVPEPGTLALFGGGLLGLGLLWRRRRARA